MAQCTPVRVVLRLFLGGHASQEHGVVTLGFWLFGTAEFFHVDEFLEIFVDTHDSGVLALFLDDAHHGVYDKCNGEYDGYDEKQCEYGHEWLEQAAERICGSGLAICQD